ncbi:class I SAM-dependent methyltransferase [bacterium]|nr:class I SAM-dependent methyltransferase [bacterium]
MSFWDIKAKRYEAIRHVRLIEWILRAEKDNIRKLIDEEGIAADIVLDIGSGSGEAGSLFPDSTQITAIDTSFSMLVQCRSKGFFAVRGDALYLPAASNYFNCVISIGVSEYIKRLDSFFSEAGRVLKKGGYFITTRAQPNIFNRLRMVSGERVRCHRENKFISSAEAEGLILKRKMTGFIQVQYLFQKN